ncbi:MAG: hypothetical protein J5876_06245 [Lachnospiraceae bacterium]|nr:hypothetical protein [Lachnospiraceae bacterium]
MDKNLKLAQVRKSCNVLEIMFKILKILCIVGASVCLIASICFGIWGNKVVSFSSDDNGNFYSNTKIDLHVFDNELFTYEKGKISGPLAPFIKRSIEDSIEDEIGASSRIELEDIFDGAYGPKAADLLNGYVRWGLFLGLLFAGGMCCVVAVIFWLVEGIFKQIKESDSPFTDAILKKLRIVFIVISILALLTNGLWAGAITALLCWAIYCIIDYGYALQLEVDETL